MATTVISSGLTIAESVIFIPLCSIVVGLRFYSRRVQKASLNIDDWLMIPGLILVLGMQITMIVEVCSRQIGYSDPNFEPGKPDASSNKAFYPIELMQIPALAIIKLSFVFFFRRIFITGYSKWLNYYSLGVIIITVAWMLAFFFSWIFICGTHPAYYWDSVETEKSYCVSTQEMHNAFSISDVILDIIVITMPLPIIWRLHMTTARKIAITAVFSLGLITIAASVTRMVIFLQSTALRYDPYIDFEHLITNGIFWSMLETGLGLITANLVVMYGLVVKQLMHSIVSTTRRLFSLPSTLLSSNSRNYSDMEHGGSSNTHDRQMWHNMKSSPGDSYAGSSISNLTSRTAGEDTKAENGEIWTTKTFTQTSEASYRN